MKNQKEQDSGYWESQISKWHRSGMSKREYYRRENISYWTFRDRVKKHGTGESVKMIKVPRKAYTIMTDSPESGIEVIISKKISIRIRKGFDGELLRELLSELGAEK